MKGAIWNILTIVTLLALTGLCILFLTLFINPYSAINPFPPPTLPPTVAIPTSTATLKSLPATWTPGAGGEGIAPQGTPLKPSQTLHPTSTGFVLPSFTPTPTHTATPTNTATITLTPTVTRTYTPTINQAATNTYNTAVAGQKTLDALSALQTQQAAAKTADAQTAEAQQATANAQATAAAAQATADCFATQEAGGTCP